MGLQPFQKRVVSEKRQLDERIEKLTEFMQGELFPTLPAAEQKRLYRQARLMREYSEVLGERIQGFSR